MTHIKLSRRWCAGWVLVVVALAHSWTIWSLGRRPQPETTAVERVQWIEARRIVEPSPPHAPTAAPASSPRRSMPPPGKRLAPVISKTIGFTIDSPPPNAPAVTAPIALDLSPETLAGTLDQARRSQAPRVPPQSWRASPHDASAPARQSETVGASGGRVTRVEGRFGTYCIRAPQPGRPPATGPGPEMALPTNCP